MMLFDKKYLTFVLVNINTILKLIFGIFLTKIIAIFLGPTGLYIIGQWQSILSIQSSIASGSIQTGIIKYTAEFKKNNIEFKRLIKNTFIILLSLSLLTSIGTILFEKQISGSINNIKYSQYIVYLLAVLTIFLPTNLYISSYLNGLSSIKKFTYVNILNTIVNFICVCIMTINFDIQGALIGFVISQPIIFILSFFIIRNSRLINYLSIRKIFNKENIIFTRRLSRFAIATLISGIMANSGLILIRSLITEEISTNQAGYWEAAFRICIYLNVLFSLPFSVHFIPIISGMSNKNMISRIIIKTSTKTLSLFSILILLYFLLKEKIVDIILTDEFQNINNFIFLLFFAEIFRILGNYISDTFTSKAHIFYVTFNQFIFYFLFVLLSYILIDSYSIYGVCFSYIISSFIYFIFFLLFYSKRFLKNNA